MAAAVSGAALLGKGLDISLAALQQHDPYISSIVDVASQVALYTFGHRANEWVRAAAPPRTLRTGEVGAGREAALPIAGGVALGKEAWRRERGRGRGGPAPPHVKEGSGKVAPPWPGCEGRAEGLPCAPVKEGVLGCSLSLPGWARGCARLSCCGKHEKTCGASRVGAEGCTGL